MTPAADLAVPAGAGPGQGAVARRRLPLRATGAFAIVGVMVLAMLLVATALVFRGAVRDQLQAIERLDAQHAMLVQRRVAAPDGKAAADLAQQLRRTEADRASALTEARHYIDGGTVVLACLAWLGITVIGALALMYFSRLANDIDSVRARTHAILFGERRRADPLARNDELSDLAHGVDDLAETLARRERDLQIERRHVMHQEKLAAIGTMAAGVLREIGNPIAAIDGYARALADARRAGELGSSDDPSLDPSNILHETARLVTITHEISELGAPPASEWQLTSLNEITTQAVGLLRYEPRLDGVAIVTHLDAQLPAIMGAADRLVLLLVNLITNAADATAQLHARDRRISVTTRCAGVGVELSVADNGSGMSAQVRERAFEPLFTTKPAGRGTGLGLPLCRAVANEHGGRIAVESAPGQGTHVRVWFPLENAHGR